MSIRKTASVGVTVGAAALLAILSAAPAGAEVRTGWIGSTPPVNGTLYLHTSTIDNAGVPKASTRVYTAFGNTVPQGVIGSKARLFREGALCSATDYQFNLFNTSSQTATSTRDCGPGFYNSHGFVAVWPSGGTMSEYITFPSDPLQYPAPAALAAPRADGEAARAQGTNPDGESYGTGEAAQADAELPDLVSAIGTNGELGYVRSDDLVGPTVDTATPPAARTVPLLSQAGDPIGSFQIG